MAGLAVAGSDEAESQIGSKTDPNTLPPAHHVADLTAALRQLDPRDWQNHDRWLQLMTACRAEGIERDDFIEWSVGDPDYADDGEIIARRWDSLAPKHGGALWAALSEAGIKLTHAQIGQAGKSVGVPLTASQTHISTRNLKSRLISLQRTVERAEGTSKERGDTLFWAACVCAEIIAEDRRFTPSAAMSLLLSAAHVNGLLREIGKESVQRTIANGFTHVEQKLLAQPERTIA
jgi:hypothetical protein